VQHDADRRGEIGRQSADNLPQRFDAAARRPDHDDVPRLHVATLYYPALAESQGGRT
jgi:hypothetical protein